MTLECFLSDKYNYGIRFPRMDSFLDESFTEIIILQGSFLFGFSRFQNQSVGLSFQCHIIVLRKICIESFGE